MRDHVFVLLLLPCVLTIIQAAGPVDIKPFKDLILRLHNGYRGMVGASDMKELVWGDELQKEADLVAKNCYIGPNQVRYGENLYMVENAVGTTKELISKALSTWYSEGVRWTKGSPCGDACQYTQVLWAKTKKIACAAYSCTKFKMVEEFVMGTWSLVCMYDTKGNTAGEQPYKTGKACSACSPNEQCKKDLCADRPPPPPVTEAPTMRPRYPVQQTSIQSRINYMSRRTRPTNQPGPYARRQTRRQMNVRKPMYQENGPNNAVPQISPQRPRQNPRSRPQPGLQPRGQPRPQPRGRPRPQPRDRLRPQPRPLQRPNQRHQRYQDGMQLKDAGKNIIQQTANNRQRYNIQQKPALQYNDVRVNNFRQRNIDISPDNKNRYNYKNNAHPKNYEQGKELKNPTFLGYNKRQPTIAVPRVTQVRPIIKNTGFKHRDIPNSVIRQEQIQQETVNVQQTKPPREGFGQRMKTQEINPQLLGKEIPVPAAESNPNFPEKLVIAQKSEFSLKSGVPAPEEKLVFSFSKPEKTEAKPEKPKEQIEQAEQISLNSQMVTTTMRPEEVFQQTTTPVSVHTARAIEAPVLAETRSKVPKQRRLTVFEKVILPNPKTTTREPTNWPMKYFTGPTAPTGKQFATAPTDYPRSYDGMVPDSYVNDPVTRGSQRGRGNGPQGQRGNGRQGQRANDRQGQRGNGRQGQRGSGPQGHRGNVRQGGRGNGRQRGRGNDRQWNDPQGGAQARYVDNQFIDQGAQQAFYHPTQAVNRYTPPPMQQKLKKVRNIDPNCKDSNSNCREWKIYCKDNVYVFENCRRTCNSCKVPSPPPTTVTAAPTVAPSEYRAEQFEQRSQQRSNWQTTPYPTSPVYSTTTPFSPKSSQIGGKNKKTIPSFRSKTEGGVQQAANTGFTQSKVQQGYQYANGPAGYAQPNKVDGSGYPTPNAGRRPLKSNARNGQAKFGSQNIGANTGPTHPNTANIQPNMGESPMYQQPNGLSGPNYQQVNPGPGYQNLNNQPNANVGQGFQQQNGPVGPSHQQMNSKPNVGVGPNYQQPNGPNGPRYQQVDVGPAGSPHNQPPFNPQTRNQIPQNQGYQQTNGNGEAGWASMDTSYLQIDGARAVPNQQNPAQNSHQGQLQNQSQSQGNQGQWQGQQRTQGQVQHVQQPQGQIMQQQTHGQGNVMGGKAHFNNHQGGPPRAHPTDQWSRPENNIHNTAQGQFNQGNTIPNGHTGQQMHNPGPIVQQINVNPVPQGQINYQQTKPNIQHGHPNVPNPEKPYHLLTTANPTPHPYAGASGAFGSSNNALAANGGQHPVEPHAQYNQVQNLPHQQPTVPSPSVPTNNAVASAVPTSAAAPNGPNHNVPSPGPAYPYQPPVTPDPWFSDPMMGMLPQSVADHFPGMGGGANAYQHNTQTKTVAGTQAASPSAATNQAATGQCVDQDVDCPNWGQYCGYNEHVDTYCHYTCRYC